MTYILRGRKQYRTVTGTCGWGRSRDMADSSHPAPRGASQVGGGSRWQDLLLKRRHRQERWGLTGEEGINNSALYLAKVKKVVSDNWVSCFGRGHS